jgi:hypothetical protein
MQPRRQGFRDDLTGRYCECESVLLQPEVLEAGWHGQADQADLEAACQESLVLDC